MSTRIKEIRGEPLNIPLKEPFRIAVGEIREAQNVLITLVLENGIVGHGEASPFPPISGETQATALAAIRYCSDLLVGLDAIHYRRTSGLLKSLLWNQPSARAGIEMAVLDALTTTWQIPLYKFFGTADTKVETDVTIPIVGRERAKELAEQIAAQGIRFIKTKVGLAVTEDVERILAIHQAAPQCRLRLDANQGFQAKEALRFLDELGGHGIQPDLLEQPVPKDDWTGLKFVTDHTSVLVAADETVFDSHDALRIATTRAANVINIKLQKSGIVEAWDIAAICRAGNIQLMIGCMLESMLGIAAAAHFAAGLGGFDFIDLDTPMLLAENPMEGGYIQRGGTYDLSTIEKGIGVRPK